MVLVEAWVTLFIISIVFVSLTAIVMLVEWVLRRFFGFRSEDSYPRR